jgi:hypothetical protein
VKINWENKIELDGFSHKNLNSVLKVWEGKWVRFKV